MPAALSGSALSRPENAVKLQTSTKNAAQKYTPAAQKDAPRARLRGFVGNKPFAPARMCAGAKGIKGTDVPSDRAGRRQPQLYFFTMAFISSHTRSMSATSLYCVRQRSRLCVGCVTLKYVSPCR